MTGPRYDSDVPDGATIEEYTDGTVDAIEEALESIGPTTPAELEEALVDEGITDSTIRHVLYGLVNDGDAGRRIRITKGGGRHPYEYALDDADADREVTAGD